MVVCLVSFKSLYEVIATIIRTSSIAKKKKHSEIIFVHVKKLNSGAKLQLKLTQFMNWNLSFSWFICQNVLKKKRRPKAFLCVGDIPGGFFTFVHFQGTIIQPIILDTQCNA